MGAKPILMKRARNLAQPFILQVMKTCTRMIYCLPLRQNIAFLKEGSRPSIPTQDQFLYHLTLMKTSFPFLFYYILLSKDKMCTSGTQPFQHTVLSEFHLWGDIHLPSEAPITNQGTIPPKFTLGN